ncbi:helix-turn-helix domain-containing protein [Nocardia sp. NPDC101769]|uniref:helix-turn-helix domain-containing protein n=1 Tax=Nocardia sp. NPDC101769 TaxID=3364333 RepID=UPI0037FEA997
MDNRTLKGWVKQETLAEATGLDVRSVKRHIRENVKAGWLKVTERGNSGGRANTYELTFPSKVTRMSPKGGRACPPNGDVDVTPTTLRTTPKSSSLTTKKKKGDTSVPHSGDGLNKNPTTAIAYAVSGDRLRRVRRRYRRSTGNGIGCFGILNRHRRGNDSDRRNRSTGDGGSTRHRRANGLPLDQEGRCTGLARGSG